MLGTSVRQNFTICKLVTPIHLVGPTFVSQHSLLFLLPDPSLLHRPLVVGVVEAVHPRKQFPRWPAIAIATLLTLIIRTGLIRIAVICISVARVALCHIAFAVYIAAIYIRNGGAAASVCSAGWTWVEELVVRSRSASILAVLERVQARRCWRIVDAIGGGRRCGHLCAVRLNWVAQVTQVWLVSCLGRNGTLKVWGKEENKSFCYVTRLNKTLLFLEAGWSVHTFRSIHTPERLKTDRALCLRTMQLQI